MMAAITNKRAMQEKKVMRRHRLVIWLFSNEQFNYIGKSNKDEDGYDATNDLFYCISVKSKYKGYVHIRVHMMCGRGWKSTRMMNRVVICIS